jgi:hypothetical protein
VLFEQITDSLSEVQALADRLLLQTSETQTMSIAICSGEQQQAPTPQSVGDELIESPTATSGLPIAESEEPAAKRRRSNGAGVSAIKKQARKAEQEFAEVLRSFVIPELQTTQRRRERWAKKQDQISRLLIQGRKTVDSSEIGSAIGDGGGESGRSRRNRPPVQVSTFSNYYYY